MAEGAAETRTTIDSLVELLKGKGKMDLNTISTALGVDTTIVENWSKVLEKGNLVKITYEVGKMFVTLSSLTPERESAEKGKLEARASALEAESASQALSLDRFAETLASIKTSVAAATRMESTQLPEVRRAIAELNSIYATVGQKNKSLEQMAKRAAELYEEINKRAAELSAKIGYLEPGSAQKGLDEAKQLVSEVTKDISSVDSDMALAGRNANDAVEQIRKAVAAQTKSINQQVDQNKKEIDAKLKQYAADTDAAERQLRERVKSMGSALSGMGDFAKERERQARKLRDIKVEFNNSYVKISDDMRTSRASVDALSRDLLAKIDILKKGFGEAAEIDDTLNTIRSQIDGIEREIAQAKQDVNDTLAQLRALNALAASATTEQRMVIIDGVEKKARATASKVSGIKGSADKAAASAKKIIKGDK